MQRHQCFELIHLEFIEQLALHNIKDVPAKWQWGYCRPF